MGGLVRGRKRPSTVLSEDEGSPVASTPDSSTSKRARTRRDASVESDGSPELGGVRNGTQEQSDAQSDDEYSEEAHQPGSIVRVTLKNFVTYTAAEFHPGPSLNMVIGPNGTGKSTLVCAICLGLGWDPKNLGRAKEIGEFVKHGSTEASIEIELAAAENHPANPVIRRQIRKEGNKSVFFLNGRPSTQKEVTKLAKSFAIQIDNLCQFLPQDRVVEFAGLSPIALLKETLRAAAPEQMVEWHEELIRLRMDEKYLQGEQAAEDAALKQLNNRQNATREDVDRWHTRQELLKKSKNLERCRPIIENNLLKREYVSLKQTRKAAEQDLRQLEADAAPTRQAQEEMEAYRETVQSVRNQRTAHVSRTQKRAEKLAADIKAEQSKITDFATQVNAEKDGEKQRRQELKRLENTIANIEREIADVPPEVDEVGYRQRRKDLSDRLMAGGRQQRETVEKLKDSKDSVTPLRNIIQEKKNEIALLDTQSGQQATLLNRTSADTARAWDWIQQNRDKLQLQGEIYGPPILTCSVDDPRHADIVESQLRPGELITITFTNSEDQRMVSGKVTGKDGLGLHAVNLKTVPKPLAFYRSPLDREDIQELGFQGYILDHIQGPEPVLAMLCDSVQIHRTAYTPHSLSEQQHEAVLRSPIMSWVAGRERYRVTRRREYAGVSSTSVNKINKARFFTDQPVDTEKKRQLNADIHNINREIAEMKEQYETLKADFDRCKAEQNEMKGQMEGLDEEYRSQVRARSQWEALPDKKAEKETDLNAVIELMRQTASRILLIKANSEKAALRSAALAIAYQTTVSELRQGHEGLVDAEIRLVEAISEVDSLKAENEGIIRAIAEAENIKAQSIQREQAVRDKLKSLQDQAKRLIRTLSDEDRAMMQEYSQLPSIEDLENEIEAVNSRLNLMAEGNPQAVHAYENREKEIASKQQRLEQIAQDLEATRAKIAEIRKEWEPRLDELVSTISDGFSHNFAQIGCAGQVGVYKDEDFEKWSIQIQVRFRENEALSILDSQRQSGGERAVSTIFYLMALQDLARSPFRVVDEINQGMDPRNERMVHERMVDIACRERTSQYFLITPKLLSDLKFHPKMKIHCIASGEHMPERYDKLDFKRLADVAVRRRVGPV